MVRGTVPERLRVVTYNTHRFLDRHGQNATDTIIADLAALDPSLVCLNEVDLRKQPGVLQDIEHKLGLKSTFFGHVGDGMYGNALLSRFPVKPDSVREIQLAGGTEVEYQGGMYRIQRGMLVAEVELGIDGTGNDATPQSLGVACTHLDHIKEEERTVQVQHALQVLADLRSLRVPHLLMGDFNALQRGDYGNEQWQRHEVFNSEQGWAPPSDSSAEGSSLWLLGQQRYTDCFRHLHAGSVGSADTAPGGSGQWTAHVGNPKYRIDYIYASPGMLANDEQVCDEEHTKWVVVDSSVVSSATGSDHFPLVVDLERMPTASAGL